MRVSLLSFVAICALGTSAVAQNSFSLYPGRTTFTSRGLLSTADGDILQLYDNAELAGIGDRGAAGNVTCNLSAFRYVIQDQNAGSRDPYSIVFRKAAAAGTPGAVIMETGKLMNPPGPNSPRAWLITASLGAGGVNLPCTGSGGDFGFHGGVHVSPNKAWTRDGLSIHASSYTIGTVGDQPRGWGASKSANKAPNLAWNWNRATKKAMQPSGRTWRMTLITGGKNCQGATCQVGAIVSTGRRGGSPNFGVAGLYPDTNVRKDGLGFRVECKAAAGGIGAVFILVPGTRTPLAGLCGSVHGTFPPFSPVAAMVLNASGVGTANPFAPGSIPLGLKAFVGWQAVFVNKKLQGFLSNATSTHFDT